MSRSRYDDDDDDIDEDELLDEIERQIPSIFIGIHTHPRTRQTIALLDYIQHLKDGQSGTPLLSDISGRKSRIEALASLKKVVPERCFKDLGFDAGKNRVDYSRDRIYVLLAAQAYLSELIPPEDRPGDDGTGLPEAQKVADLEYPLPDLHDITAAAPTINDPIDRLALHVREAQNFARKQDEQLARLTIQNQQLAKDKDGLEQVVEDQRRELGKQRQAVEDAGVLRSIMTAAVGREVVETTLRLVREGRRVEDVVAEVLKKAPRS